MVSAGRGSSQALSKCGRRAEGGRSSARRRRVHTWIRPHGSSLSVTCTFVIQSYLHEQLRSTTDQAAQSNNVQWQGAAEGTAAGRFEVQEQSAQVQGGRTLFEEMRGDELAEVLDGSEVVLLRPDSYQCSRRTENC